MTLRNRIKVLAAFWQGVERLKIRRSEVLRAAQLPASAGQDNAHLTTANLFALWRGLKALRGPDVGLALSTALDGSVMPPSFLAAYHGRDLRDALVRVARFKRLCAPEEIDIAVKDGDAVVQISWSYATGAVPTALIDATMASIVDIAVTGIEDRILAKRIERRGTPGSHLQPHYGCPVHGQAPDDLLVFHAADLDRSFKSHNLALLTLLDDAVRQRATETLIDQVRWILRRNLTAGRLDLRSIARELSISERSLQRRLNDEGHSFQSRLSAARHDLTCEYLFGPDYEFAEIGYLLGYNDPASFYRAFQKWEGSPPAQWRAGRAA